ncbi:hypothetical protein Aperf_G00000005016 [Anoplocephala perfoliata]
MEKRLRFLQFSAFCHGITFLSSLISVIIFGVNHRNPDWMPYPTLNWASWSYGLAVLSTFCSLSVTLAFAFTWGESKRTLETAGYEFPMSAVMKKREKQAILEEQEKKITAAGLEPITRPLGPLKEEESTTYVPSAFNSEEENAYSRRLRDLRGETLNPNAY